MSKQSNGWVGFDLDSTLAVHHPGDGINTIGKPTRLLEVLRGFLKEGIECRIMTARAGKPGQEKLIHEWLEKHGLPPLQVTNQKDFKMLRLYDDRAVQVVPNSGYTLEEVMRVKQASAMSKQAMLVKRK